jgi:diguanylate cyclase (GGDEF)-like protein
MSSNDVSEHLASLQGRLARISVWRSLPAPLDQDFRRYVRLRRRPQRVLVYLLPLFGLMLAPPALPDLAGAEWLRWSGWLLVLPLSLLAAGLLFVNTARTAARVVEALAIGAVWLWLIALRAVDLHGGEVDLSPQLLGLSWLAVALLAGFAWQRLLPAIGACVLLAIVQELYAAPAELATVQNVLGLLFAALLAAWAVVHDERLHRELWLHYETGRTLRRVDSLTGLANRREWSFQVARRLTEARRDGQAVVLALVDIDGFAEINAREGHLVGDETLRQLAQALIQRGARRASDLVARYGDDQFALFQQAATPDMAHRLAQRVLEAARGLTIDNARQRRLEGVRVSVATLYLPDVSRINPDQLEAELESLMLEIKRAGGGRHAHRAVGIVREELPSPPVLAA